MSRPTQVLASEQRTCRCQSMITLVPWTVDVGVRIPVDVDRDPVGSLVVVGSRQGFTVRLLLKDELPQATMRRRAHWETCPYQHDWAETMTRLGLRVSSIDRSGPCPICGRRHAWRYGTPIASPVCDPCRVEQGWEPMGEAW